MLLRPAAVIGLERTLHEIPPCLERATGTNPAANAEM